MKIFLSSLETSCFDFIDSNIEHYLYNLVSFYYIRDDTFRRILKKSELILVDSGAHTFQKHTDVDWVDYTSKYADWIKQNDCDKIIGYFEMDVDNKIGYENVLKLRKMLEKVTDKIIPVWHKNRGIEEFKKMCEEYSGRIVAITGFLNEDIRDDQYMIFLKYAKKFNCKVHCLGMTRKKVLDKVPFDYCDSSTWKQESVYGRIGKKKVSREYSRENYHKVLLCSYLNAMDMQKHYEKKWRDVKWNVQNNYLFQQ